MFSTGDGIRTETLYTIESAVARLGSRLTTERNVGLRELARVFDDVLSASADESSIVDFHAALRGLQKAVAVASGIPLIVGALLQCRAGSHEIQSQSHVLHLIYVLALDQSAFCGDLAAAGCIEPLIALLASSSISVQREAAGALCNLCTDSVACAMIVAAGGISPLVPLLESASEDVRENASSALRKLGAAYSASISETVAPDDAGFCAAIICDIPAAVVMLGSREATDRESGLSMLVAIVDGCLGPAEDDESYRSMRSELQAAVFAAGGIPVLARVLKSCYDASDAAALREGITYLIQVLSARNTTVCHALSGDGCIVPLIALLSSTSKDVLVNTAGALENLCAGDDATAARIVSAGGIPRLMALLQSSSRHVRENALDALHVLRSVDLSAQVSVVARDVTLYVCVVVRGCWC